MDFRGKRILIVEDDYFLANEVSETFRRHEATVLGPAPTPFYAANLLSRRVDGAILDVRLHSETVFDLADLLLERGTPLIFATAMGSEHIPERFRGMGYVQKPYLCDELISKMDRLVSAPRHLDRPIVVEVARTEGRDGHDRLAQLLLKMMRQRLALSETQDRMA
jgi:DNA-binding response OmpR family regulator